MSGTSLERVSTLSKGYAERKPAPQERARSIERGGMAVLPAAVRPFSASTESDQRTRRGSMSDSGLGQLSLSMREDLRRFLCARGLAHDEAEDLLQDLFVKITTSKMGPVTQPKAYLYRMANNLAHDHRRSRGRSALRDKSWTEHFAGPDLDHDPQPGAERSLMAKDELLRVKEALDTLPERTREIFCSYRLDGVPQRVIAERMALSLSAVEKHLKRAYLHVLAVKRELAEPEAESQVGSKSGGRSNARSS